jgi:hypothetical protein
VWYYFDDGFNTTIEDETRKIFNVRAAEKAEMKKAKKALEQDEDPREKNDLKSKWQGTMRCSWRIKN